MPVCLVTSTAEQLNFGHEILLVELQDLMGAVAYIGGPFPTPSFILADRINMEGALEECENDWHTVRICILAN